MMIARYKNGFDQLFPRTFQHVVDNMLNDTNGGRATQAPFGLKVDAFETPAAFELHAAVPGFSKENISIDLNDRKLTLSGERKQERREDQKYHLLETSFGRFSRTFNLPENVNTEGISASFENGMLRVVLPKDEQHVQRRKIEIADATTATGSTEVTGNNEQTEEQK